MKRVLIKQQIRPVITITGRIFVMYRGVDSLELSKQRVPMQTAVNLLL